MVSTSFKVVLAILRHRHRHQGWLLGALGSFLAPQACPGRREMISNLVHGAPWFGEEVCVSQQANLTVAALAAAYALLAAACVQPPDLVLPVDAVPS